ncbi:SLATT domain-containing protein [Salmonella enterica subsp. enterica serovar Livingstone]|nr:SLATT domain-containing protein [Salmonella enterica subsp. enterica serovar Livingstone]
MDKDNVWFTYKARIHAYHRLEQMDIHSQLLLVWYAIIGAILAVVAVRHPDVLGDDTDVFGAVLSITLLGVSLSIANRDFRGRAINMRKNYLALQCLYNELKNKTEITQNDTLKYDELLNEVENHNEMDDKIFRVKNYIRLTSRKPEWTEHIQVYIHVIIKYIVLILLYLAPLIVAWFLR